MIRSDQKNSSTKYPFYKNEGSLFDTEETVTLPYMVDVIISDTWPIYANLKQVSSDQNFAICCNVGTRLLI